MKKIVIGLAIVILILSSLLISKYIYTDNNIAKTQTATGEVIDTGEVQSPEDNTEEDNNDNAVKKAETTNLNPVNQELKKSLQSKANILVGEVETKLKLSKIKLKREKCDEENAFYDSETKDITIYDEMITQLYKYAQKESTDPKIQEEITENSLFFILFHELGHGYIDMYQLPITGKEEDVADQIATYLILGLNKDTSYIWISDGAFAFYKFAEDNPIDEGGLADAHSLDKQRFYNISCWLYGANKDESIISERGLPQERAEGCEDEYNLMKDSLDALLKQ